MTIRKSVSVILLLAVVGLALAACMNDNGTRLSSTPAPTVSFAPEATNGYVGNGNGANTTGTARNDAATGANQNAGTGATGNTASTADGALNPFDWANSAADIEKAIGQISELSEARVVVTNTTALVGVKFDGAYKGQLTERIREMVAAEVLKADPTIQTVAVTSDQEDVEKIYTLSDQIRAGRTADELSAEINSIVRNATTLR